GAAAASRQQVAALATVEVRRAGQAADQPVFAGAAVDLVGAQAGRDQVVLGAADDRVVALAAGEADEVDRFERAFDVEAVVAGAEVGHDPAAGPFRRAGERGEHAAQVFAAGAGGERGLAG